MPRDRSSFDIQELFANLGLDSSTDLLFGESVDTLLSDHEQDLVNDRLPFSKAEFREAFDYTQEILVRRVFAQKLYWLISPQKFKDAAKTVHEFIDYYVERAVRVAKDATYGREKQGGRYIFLEALALETDDKRVLRDQLLHILLAGRDTTSSLLSSVFYFLSRNQQVWQRLRQEILDQYGCFGENKEELTFETLKSSKYLKHVINESESSVTAILSNPLFADSFGNQALRLIPPVPLNSRVALKDTILPVGGGSDGKSPILVRKGQSIRYTCFAMHRRRDIWGDGADQFRPERWETFTPQAWDFLPFNGGPRICLGREYQFLQDQSFRFLLLVKICS